MGKWLVKTDPDTYSVEDLQRDRQTTWDGVRNALAQRHLRAMQKGDAVLVYHSGSDKAVLALAEVLRAAHPDPTDKTGKCSCVDLKFVSLLKRPVGLARVKAEPKLKDFPLLRMSRLSVMPVSEEQWRVLLKLAESA